MARMLVPPSAPPLTLTERQWQRLVEDLAQHLGWLTYHTFDSRRSEAGYPDLTLVRERLVMVELKTQRGRVRPEQITWAESLQSAGVEYYLWRPSDWDTILETLR